MSPYMVKRVVGFVTVIATAVLVFMVTLVVSQCIQINKLNRESKLLEANIERLAADKTDLLNGIDYRTSAEYVEQQARESLGMIKDGEVVYIFG